MSPFRQSATTRSHVAGAVALEAFVAAAGPMRLSDRASSSSISTPTRSACCVPPAQSGQWARGARGAAAGAPCRSPSRSHGAPIFANTCDRRAARPGPHASSTTCRTSCTASSRRPQRRRSESSGRRCPATSRAPASRRCSSYEQGLVAATRSGLPGALFGRISVEVHLAALFASAMTGTPGVSTYVSPGPMTFGLQVVWVIFR